MTHTKEIFEQLLPEFQSFDGDLQAPSCPLSRGSKLACALWTCGFGTKPDLIEEESIENNPPLSSTFFEKEEKAAVGLVVDFYTIECEAGSDCHFHLGDLTIA